MGPQTNDNLSFLHFPLSFPCQTGEHTTPKLGAAIKGKVKNTPSWCPEKLCCAWLLSPSAPSGGRVGWRAQHKSVYKTEAKGRKTHANKDFGLWQRTQGFSLHFKNKHRQGVQPRSENLNNTRAGYSNVFLSSAQERISATFLAARQRWVSLSRASPGCRLCNLLSPPPHPRVPGPPPPHVPAGAAPPSAPPLRASSAGPCPHRAGDPRAPRAVPPPPDGATGASPAPRGRPRPPRLTQPLSAPGPAEAPRPRRGTLTVKGWSCRLPTEKQLSPGFTAPVSTWCRFMAEGAAARPPPLVPPRPAAAEAALPGGGAGAAHARPGRRLSAALRALCAPWGTRLSC